MFLLILIVHGVLCAFMIGLVLLQQGKGADAGALMGGSSDSIFGPGGGGSFATRLTTGVAIGFMITSIFLVRMYGTGAYVRTEAPNPLEGSLMDKVAVPQPESAAKAPEATGTAAPAPEKGAAGTQQAPAAAAQPAAGTEPQIAALPEKPVEAAPGTGETQPAAK